MMSTIVITIVCTVLGSGGLFTLIQFLINRHDSKTEELKKINERLDGIDKKLVRSELDSCRTQTLVLMSDYPEEKAELMKLAEHYFKDLHGDWYCTDLFCKYLQENHIEKPPWFSGGES